MARIMLEITKNWIKNDYDYVRYIKKYDKKIADCNFLY